MDTIDTPVKTHFHHGKVFPPNALLIGYVLLIAGGFSLFVGITWIGAGIALLGMFIVFTTYGTSIDTEKKNIIEFNYFFGFIPYKRIKSYSKYHYLAVIPKQESTTVYSRTNSSTTYSQYYQSVCLLTEHYLGKLEITKFDKKDQAVQTAKDLAFVMGLKYFIYDPHIVSAHLRSIKKQ